MTKRLERLAARHRLSAIYWLLNAVILAALLAFALR